MFALILKMNSHSATLKCEDSQKQTIIEVIKDDNKIKQETDKKFNDADRDALLAYGLRLGIMRNDESY